MGLVSLLILLLVFLAFVFIIISFIAKAKGQSKPSKLGISALLLQLLFLILFFKEAFVDLNEVLVDILWWAVIIYGCIIGMKERKYHLPTSLLILFCSVVLTMFMLLGIFITSM